jgi:hypothetical protein
LYAKEDQVAFADTAQFHVVSLSSLDALNREILSSSHSVDSVADPIDSGASPVSMCRFRPNIGKFYLFFLYGQFIFFPFFCHFDTHSYIFLFSVVDGFPEYDEDRWRVVRFGNKDHASANDGAVALRVCMPDLRCSVVDNIQSGEQAGNLGTPTLRLLQEMKRIRPATLRAGCAFGVKLNVFQGADERRSLSTSISVGDECVCVQRTETSLLQLDLVGLRKQLLGRDLSMKDQCDSLFASIKSAHAVMVIAVACIACIVCAYSLSISIKIKRVIGCQRDTLHSLIFEFSDTFFGEGGCHFSNRIKIYASEIGECSIYFINLHIYIL